MMRCQFCFVGMNNNPSSLTAQQYSLAFVCSVVFLWHTDPHILRGLNVCAVPGLMSFR